MDEAIERNRMLSGELYLASDPFLNARRQRARRLCRLYNSVSEYDPARRNEILGELFGKIGARADASGSMRGGLSSRSTRRGGCAGRSRGLLNSIVSHVSS